jgi:hypothetical protein
MILKAMNLDTGRWVHYESDRIELGKMWLGIFGDIGEPMTQLALYDQPEEPMRDPDAVVPAARKVPILLGADVGCPTNSTDVLVDVNYTKEIFDTQGKERKQVNMAVLRKANGDEQIVVFDRPAYLINDAGKTIDKL